MVLASVKWDVPTIDLWSPFKVTTLTTTNLVESTAETFERRLEVAALLHRNDAAVVLLVDPHEESLLVVVPGDSDNTRVID